MRVLVDTSAWVEFLNGQASPEAGAVAELLVGDDDVCTCGVVIAEVFQGLRRERERNEIAERFRDMTFLDATGPAPYFRAAELFRGLRARGRTVRSTIDCLIVVLAERHGCRVLARDRDVTTILDSGLTRVQAWRPR